MQGLLWWGAAHPWLFVFVVLVVANVILGTARTLRRSS